MNYDFDELIDRTNTDSYKWDKYKNRDIIPLWVADMDFKTPGFIAEKIRMRAEHELYGYSFRPSGYFSSIVKFCN